VRLGRAAVNRRRRLPTSSADEPEETQQKRNRAGLKPKGKDVGEGCRAVPEADRDGGGNCIGASKLDSRNRHWQRNLHRGLAMACDRKARLFVIATSSNTTSKHEKIDFACGREESQRSADDCFFPDSPPFTAGLSGKPRSYHSPKQHPKSPPPRSVSGSAGGRTAASNNRSVARSRGPRGIRCG